MVCKRSSAWSETMLAGEPNTSPLDRRVNSLFSRMQRHITPGRVNGHVTGRARRSRAPGQPLGERVVVKFVLVGPGDGEIRDGPVEDVRRRLCRRSG